jgi:hypothetical protein
MFRVKMDKNQPELEEVDSKKILRKSMRRIDISLSKNVLKEMRKKAGIVNDTSDKAILLAYITKTLSE